MTRFVPAITVLLIHTGAAFAQQAPTDQAPLAEGPGTTHPASPTPVPVEGPPAPTPATPAPSPAAANSPTAIAAPQDYPPGYGPPPGYATPPAYYGPPRGYGPAPGYGRQRGYGAPPGYGPRPGYYHAYPSYEAQPMPPPRRITDRPFVLGGGIGFGGLRLESAGRSNSPSNSSSQGGFAYTARLGLGLTPGLILMWDIEGAIVNRGASSFSQTAHLAALQMFIGDRLFLKGGFGLAQVNQDDLSYSNWGGAIMGGVGLELVQGWNWSFDVESTATAARYNDETWINWSLVNFAVNFF